MLIQQLVSNLGKRSPEALMTSRSKVRGKALDDFQSSFPAESVLAPMY